MLLNESDTCTLYDQYLKNDPRFNFSDIEKIKNLNDYELLILKRDGKQIIYDTMLYTTRGCVYHGPLNDKENKNEFKLRLNSLAYHAGLNQRTLSIATGISERTLSRYFTGKSIPDYINLKKLSDALGCSVNDLYFDGF